MGNISELGNYYYKYCSGLITKSCHNDDIINPTHT